MNDTPKRTKKSDRNALQRELYDHMSDLKHMRAILAKHERWVMMFSELLIDLNPNDVGEHPALLLKAYAERAEAEEESRQTHRELNQMKKTLAAWALEYGKKADEPA